MRRFAVLLFSLLSGALALAQGSSADSLRFARIGEKLDEYVASLEGLSPDLQAEECDFLIEACQDSLDRQFVTVRLYDHYLSSPLMGSENVAVHILDRWVLSGEVAMYDDLDYLNAYVFADFNRNSLLGREALPLRLEDPDGDIVEMGWTPAYGKYRVLIFYSPDCVTCRLSVPQLTVLAGRYGNDVIFDAIDVEPDRDAWKRYIASREDFSVRMMHYTIPEGETDYQRDFGVNHTPQVLLLDPDGIIIGRRLDAEALGQLLDRELQLYEGADWEDAQAFVASLAAPLGEDPTPQQVLELASSIVEGTGGSGTVYKQLMVALLREFAFRKGHNAHFAADALARKYVLDCPAAWPTEVDEREVTEHARLITGLMDLSPVGSKVPALKVHGTRYRGTSARTATFRLRRLTGCLPPFSGTAGSEGTAGSVGTTGSEGAAGSEGATGDEGTAGGEHAASSVAGKASAASAASGEGTTGGEGAAGSEGATGDVGAAGDEGTASSVAGKASAASAAGGVGAAGSEGTTGGVGAAGSVGAAGDEGATGSEGAAGGEHAASSDAGKASAASAAGGDSASSPASSRRTERDARIVFYSPGCAHCQALLESLPAALAAHPRRTFLLVNIDELLVNYPAEAEALFSAFDLSSLPMVISVGRDRRITDKYLDNL